MEKGRGSSCARFGLLQMEVGMKSLSKRLFAVSALAVSLVSVAWPAPATPKPGDDAKVAVVNGSVITQADLDREMAAVQKRLSSSGRTVDAAQLNDMRKDVLEGLINREILYQESKKHGIKVEEAAVDERVNAVKRRFPDEKGFGSALAAAGLSEASFRSMIGRDLAIQQFFTQQFIDKATVTDQETKTYYEEHPEAFKQPAQVRASHILIKVDPQANESQKAEAKKKIQDIRKRIQKEGDFEALAKEYSDCPSGSNGGDLGFFGRGQMVGPFEEAAFALKPGEMSDVVETQFGYHLIRLKESKPEGTVAFQEVKDRVNNHLKQDKARRELASYVDGIKGKAKIERILKDKAE